jgi:hypothetical protein
MMLLRPTRILTIILSPRVFSNSGDLELELSACDLFICKHAFFKFRFLTHEHQPHHLFLTGLLSLGNLVNMRRSQV